MAKSDDYMPWRDQQVLDIIGDNMWFDQKEAEYDQSE